MRYEAILDDALQELGSTIQALRWAETAILASSPIQKRSVQQVITSTYVLIAATIENYTRLTLEKLIIDIRNSGARKNEIQFSLYSLFGSQQLASIRDLEDYQKSWGKRKELFDLLASTAPLNTLSPDIPLDGKTIRPSHLEVIWEIFSLPNRPFPNALCRAALVDIADGRNEVAHGHSSVATFAKKKGVRDTVLKINRIEELLTHVSLQVMYYIENRGYIRT